MAVERAARTPKAANPVDDGVRPRLFTVEEYYQMAEAGVIGWDERIELLEGVIVEMAPIGDDHVSATIDLTSLFVTRFLGRADVSVQSPVYLGTRSELEPGFSIVRPVPGGRRKAKARKPNAEDTFLVVEVANSSLAYDLGVKARTFALRGIVELWVIDIPHDRLVMHREPKPDGYASVTVVERGATVSALAFPDIVFTADEILG